ncbi:hypothetical protein RIF29_29315 [Crotalaria pallida]|uniref:Uncharacterized protein n=1 Tax=Crotalaria pallida TaxID=3830 RepID=A0AAN9EL43_CROPI
MFVHAELDQSCVWQTWFQAYTFWTPYSVQMQQVWNKSCTNMAGRVFFSFFLYLFKSGFSVMAFSLGNSKL